MPPRTRYARNGDVSIAYQVSGDGPIDLVIVPGFISHLDLDWAGLGVRALRRPAGVVRAADPVRQARNGPVRSRARSADARGAHGGRPRRDGRRRIGARRAVRLLRGRPDGSALRRHLSGADARARHVRDVSLRARARKATGRSRSSTSSTNAGERAAIIDVFAPSRRARRSGARGVRRLRAGVRQPRDGERAPGGRRRDGRHRRAARGPGADARASPPRRVHTDRGSACDRGGGPGRPAGRARGHRPPAVPRRLGRDRRGGRGVPDRSQARRRA